MAKIWQISDGRSYVVNGDPGTTITYTNSPSNGTAAGKPVTSIPTGATSVTFPSNGSEVEISSDTATIDQVFNAAAAGSGSSSGGSGSAGGVTFQIVTTLPSQGAAGVIYLVKVSETGDDKFEEWIWVDSAWESIGTTAVDPTTYAKLIGGNTFEGNQVINGDLTVTGDVSGVTESNYNVVETAETTITPTGGTWVRYTGSETSLTVVEPGWDGEAEISYLETATPVDLQGVTWSPAKPILTGNGPFVYTLVHAGPGQMLAGAYGYSVATAEAVQSVVPMAFGEYTTAPSCTGAGSIVLGDGAKTDKQGVVVIGQNAGSTGNWGGGVHIGMLSNGYGNGAVSIGYSANVSANYGIAISTYSKATASNATAIQIGARALGLNSVAFGNYTKSDKPNSLTFGAQFTETTDSGNVTHTCTTEGTGSITIGAGANTLNNGDTESSNSITIGCKAVNQGADSVVIGASGSNVAFGAVAIGALAKAAKDCGVALGYNAKASNLYSVAIGGNTETSYGTVSLGNQAKSLGTSALALGSQSEAKAEHSVSVGGSSKSVGCAIALGRLSNANARHSVAVGYNASVSDYGATVIRSTAEDGTYTQLYFSGANTPLANTYHGGAPMLGYVTKDSAGNIVAAGTRSLIDLLTDNSTFAPASLDENGEWVMPKVFHPSDLDMPQEEPTEPEEYQPLPVWPIVEPEDVTTNIPEPEPYTPLPIYPIVEPEVPEIVEEPTE